MFLWCVRDGWRQGQSCYIDPNFFSLSKHTVLSSRTHLALLTHLGWGCSTGGCWGQDPSRDFPSLPACSHSGLPISNWLNGRRHLPIFFHNAHLLQLLLPLIYTGESLIKVLPLQFCVDLGAAAMKGHSIFLKDQRVELYPQIYLVSYPTTLVLKGVILSLYQEYYGDSNNIIGLEKICQGKVINSYCTV